MLHNWIKQTHEHSNIVNFILNWQVQYSLICNWFNRKADTPKGKLIVIGLWEKCNICMIKSNVIILVYSPTMINFLCSVTRRFLELILKTCKYTYLLNHSIQKAFMGRSSGGYTFNYKVLNCFNPKLLTFSIKTRYFIIEMTNIHGNLTLFVAIHFIQILNYF